MLTLHIILPKQTNFKSLGLFENLAFVIMSTRENIRLIARASLTLRLLTPLKYHILENIIENGTIAPFAPFSITFSITFSKVFKT